MSQSPPALEEPRRGRHGKFGAGVAVRVLARHPLVLADGAGARAVATVLAWHESRTWKLTVAAKEHEVSKDFLLNTSTVLSPLQPLVHSAHLPFVWQLFIP